MDEKKIELWNNQQGNVNVAGRDDVLSCLDNADGIIKTLVEELKFLKSTSRVFRAYLDGNALCIVGEDFDNLQDNEAFFVTLTGEKIKEWKEFSKK